MLQNLQKHGRFYHKMNRICNHTDGNQAHFFVARVKELAGCTLAEPAVDFAGVGIPLQPSFFTPSALVYINRQLAYITPH